MPRGIRLSPEERAERLVEYKRVRAEKKKQRLIRSKDRAKKLAEDIEKKKIIVKRQGLHVYGTFATPWLDTLKKKFDVIEISSAAEASKNRLKVMFVDSVEKLREIDAHDEAIGTIACLVGTMTSKEAEEMELARNVWVTFLPRKTKNVIIGGPRAYSGRISETLKAAWPTLETHKTSLKIAAMVAEITIAIASGIEAAEARQQLMAKYGHVAEDACELAG